MATFGNIYMYIYILLMLRVVGPHDKTCAWTTNNFSSNLISNLMVLDLVASEAHGGNFWWYFWARQDQRNSGYWSIGSWAGLV
jgi:hypothetical protein